MKIRTRILQFLCPLALALSVVGCDSSPEPSKEPQAQAIEPQADVQAPAGQAQERGNMVCLESEAHGSCEDSCGGKSKTGCCFCDDQCEYYGDCCDDYVEECVEEETCGGRHNRKCSDRGDFCLFEPRDHCGEHGEEGLCVERPDDCSKRKDPVCGCDGKTYRNECMAHAKGVSIEHKGRCENNECGGRLGNTCDRGEFCSFELNAVCGRGDATGLCEDRPDSCGKERKPVCGCNDRTYRNECRANKAGVSILHQGACHAQEGDECGGRDNVKCAAGLYCHFRDKDGCKKHRKGVCVERGGGCDEHSQPVCGCDDVTYVNLCQAEAQGASIQHEGPCQ